MVGANGSRASQLLRQTFEHYQPSRIAAAVALGLLAGLVPKTNLLAPLIYAALILLPVHTVLGLVVSLAVSLVSGYFDWFTHAVGNGLLQQDALRPMWVWFDNTAILPWFELHNTVTLGSLVTGIALLAPSYWLTLRAVERMQWNSMVSLPQSNSKSKSKSNPKIISQPAGAGLPAFHLRPGKHLDIAAATANVPPPKFSSALQKSAARRSAPQSTGSPQSTESRQDAEIDDADFEPVREVTSIINAWHMGHASATARVLQPVSSDVSGASNDQPQIAASDTDPAQHAAAYVAQQIDAARALDTSAHSQIHSLKSGNDCGNLNSGAESSSLQNGAGALLHRDERILSSLELAHTASDVLAWVDGLLDECLSTEGMPTRVDARSLESHSTSPSVMSDTDQPPTDSASAATDERWLMETSIEIVRWADQSLAAPVANAPELCTDVSSVLPVTYPDSVESMQSVPAQLAQLPAVVPASETEAPQVISMLQHRHATEQRATARGETLIKIPEHAQGRHVEHSPVDDEQPRGECLSYLLEHLRQARVERST